jgi:hypothetical protein
MEPARKPPSGGFFIPKKKSMCRLLMLGLSDKSS